MTAVSLIAAQGQCYKISDFTVGTVAPNSSDMQVCWNLTNTNGKNIQTRDVIIFLENVIYWLKNESPTAGLTDGSTHVPYFGTGTPPPAV